jgi:hypothetical protein
MRRRILIALLVLAVAAGLYAAHSFDLVGTIVRGHSGLAAGHSG